MIDTMIGTLKEEQADDDNKKRVLCSGFRFRG